MPTLKKFAKETGLPKMRRWKLVYAQIRAMEQFKKNGYERIQVPVKEFHIHHLAMLMFSNFGIRKADNHDLKCYIPTKEGMLKIIDHLAVFQYPYVADKADCENYAYGLMAFSGLVCGANSFGALIYNQHASCIGFYTDEKGRLTFAGIEPQHETKVCEFNLKIDHPKTAKVVYG